MSQSQSAQSPSGDPQPPKQESYLSSSNPVSKTAAESSHSHTSSGSLGRENCSQSQQSESHSHMLQNTLAKQRDEESSEGGGHSQLSEGGANGDKETEQVKMAPPSEGKVARSVEGTRESAREMQQQRQPGEGHVQAGERGKRYDDLGLGGEHGAGGNGPGQGQRNEGGLERKKAQQSSHREQVKEARSEGQDVDGGSFGARPHADVEDI